MRPVPYDLCLPLIFEFEGKAGKFRPTPALDPAGNWEIGWGHKLRSRTFPDTIDAAQAEVLARSDLAVAADAVCSTLSHTVLRLTEGQYAALIDFTYNVGGANFAASTLAHFVYTGRLEAAEQEFDRWKWAHVNGVATVEPGLLRRREAELALWRQA